MKTLSLWSLAALTSAIRASPPTDELQDKIKDLTFRPAGCRTASRNSSFGGERSGGTADSCTRNRRGAPADGYRSRIILAAVVSRYSSKGAEVRCAAAL